MNIQIQSKLFIRTNQIKQERQSIWFLHGFADSGLAYKEVFDSPLNEDFNIYVIDLPGFGVSPINSDYVSIKEQANLISNIVEKETSNQNKVNLVAHSLGALIGTWTCQNLREKVNYYFNIEGNLTEADSYFSSKPTKFESEAEFVESFNKEIFERAKSEERYKRYYCSLRLAEPDGMWNWGLTSQEHTIGNKCGIEFKELACKKVYIWGDVDTPKETQKFIKENEIPNRLYKGIGHWHMVENHTQLYNDINEKLKSA
ncbi:alpha/beta fold hydrolase [Flagellimonas nanhaiensis]|uniref:Alpha/beta fold hydrolase n=1 Tax=Flagellimonas nanhaiensis TaxID=2292706 RepID=A0A371JUU1_9FLAO|nr:alpha/beta fold hydrolase [Allomuricauda nanhaiensis]RDY61546.1 alpha/beta fold hydrolase [Allomuricauda nanhaiensis]